MANRAPGLTELHYLGGRSSNWLVDHIQRHTAAFLDETGPEDYTDGSRFETEAWLENAPGARTISRRPAHSAVS
jgi:hypothetical protein